MYVIYDCLKIKCENYAKTKSVKGDNFLATFWINKLYLLLFTIIPNFIFF